MSETSHSDMFESLSTAWETAINEKRQREVVLSGVIAYLFFHEKKDTGLENGALMYVREAIDNLFQDKFGQQPSDVAQRACSFCDRREPEIRLAAGAKGFICDACVSTLAEVFKEPTDK